MALRQACPVQMAGKPCYPPVLRRGDMTGFWQRHGASRCFWCRRVLEPDPLGVVARLITAFEERR